MKGRPLGRQILWENWMAFLALPGEWFSGRRAAHQLLVHFKDNISQRRANINLESICGPVAANPLRYLILGVELNQMNYASFEHFAKKTAEIGRWL
jgi:hypothetical protein